MLGWSRAATAWASRWKRARAAGSSAWSAGSTLSATVGRAGGARRQTVPSAGADAVEDEVLADEEFGPAAAHQVLGLERREEAVADEEARQVGRPARQGGGPAQTVHVSGEPGGVQRQACWTSPRRSSVEVGAAIATTPGAGGRNGPAPSRLRAKDGESIPPSVCHLRPANARTGGECVGRVRLPGGGFRDCCIRWGRHATPVTE